MVYELELLHPGWFGKRKYRTLAGIYDSLPQAQAVDTTGAGWRREPLIIGRHQYWFLECHPFGSSGAWWRITEVSRDTVESPENGVKSSAVNA